MTSVGGRGATRHHAPYLSWRVGAAHGGKPSPAPAGPGCPPVAAPWKRRCHRSLHAVRFACDGPRPEEKDKKSKGEPRAAPGCYGAYPPRDAPVSCTAPRSGLVTGDRGGSHVCIRLLRSSRALKAASCAVQKPSTFVEPAPESRRGCRCRERPYPSVARGRASARIS
jgi:hypothetical protein